MRIKMKRNTLITAALLVCWAVWHAFSSAHAAQPIPVKAIRVTLQTAQVAIPGSGSLRCAETLQLGFEGTGVVSKVSVEEGDRVTEGQVLVELDSSVLEAETKVKQAELEASDAEVNYFTTEKNKMEQLHDKKAISDTDFEKAARQMTSVEARRNILKAELKALAARKQQRVLRSPISGVVAKRYVDTGSVVTPGFHRVLRLLQCREMVAVIELGERYYNLVRPGQPVKFKVDALGGREYACSLCRMCPEIERTSKSFTVEARMDNPDVALAGGMCVQALIEVTTGQPSVWIPKEALLSPETDHKTVYVIQDSKLVKREVVMGQELEDRLEITTGLSEGDVVAVEGHRNIPELTLVSAMISGQE